MRLALLLPVLLTAARAGNAQTLNIIAEPSTATIYRFKVQDNSLVPIGTGRAELKLQKNDPNTIVVRLDGFRDATRSFPTGEKYRDKQYTLFLSKRVIQLSALPYDAEIRIDGEPRGTRQVEVELEEGQAATVEVVKRGFAPVQKVYRWEKAGEMPPAKDRIELLDRRVMISASPSGAELFGDDAKIGDTDAELTVRRGTCATVRAAKPGWIPVERNYCNKDGLPETPLADRIALAGRVVNVNAPSGARILVNQKQAGTGSFQVRVAEGACVQVEVQQQGYFGYNREFCVQPGVAPEPPQDDNVVLDPDDSYAASSASDQANVNVTVEVAAGMPEERAWKLLASIVLSHFDVLENSDSQTGYLRTAWQLKTYTRRGGSAPERVIRSRIIVKRASDDPLRYTVKIVSEKNKYAGVSVKEDENFEAWDRLLNVYRDVIAEMQSRLK